MGNHREIMELILPCGNLLQLIGSMDHRKFHSLPFWKMVMFHSYLTREYISPWNIQKWLLGMIQAATMVRKTHDETDLSHLVPPQSVQNAYALHVSVPSLVLLSRGRLEDESKPKPWKHMYTKKSWDLVGTYSSMGDRPISIFNKVMRQGYDWLRQQRLRNGRKT